MKIEKSKAQNAERINRIRKVNEYVDSLKKDTRAEFRETMKNDPAAYKELLKNLLVQVSTFSLSLNTTVGFDQAYGGSNFHQMQKGG
jgi:hypothetical protein